MQIAAIWLTLVNITINLKSYKSRAMILKNQNTAYLTTSSYIKAKELPFLNYL